MGVTTIPGTLGCTMDAPADIEYAVLPVGVEMIKPKIEIDGTSAHAKRK